MCGWWGGVEGRLGGGQTLAAVIESPVLKAASASPLVLLFDKHFNHNVGRVELFVDTAEHVRGLASSVSEESVATVTCERCR